MRSLATAVLVLASAAAMAVGEHFTVSAAYVPPAKPKAAASVAVTFIPADPDVKINQEPAPRLKLDPEQVVLVDRQPPAPRRGESGGEQQHGRGQRPHATHRSRTAGRPIILRLAP